MPDDGPITRFRRRLGRRIAGEPPPAHASDPDWEALDPPTRAIVERALPNTMTGIPRLHALIDAVRYLVARDVPGALAECGVWRGGSVLAMILALQEQDRDDRDIYLYDTFEGMTEPTEADVSRFHPPALELWEQSAGKPWPELFGAEAFSEDSVRETLYATGYPQERLHFVRGPVESTVPGTLPERLALLRLDTDWYESSLHELVHMYPLLASGGVLILDDYGHWEGQRRATDEYFSGDVEPILLGRIDHAGRIAVKH